MVLQIVALNVNRLVMLVAYHLPSTMFCLFKGIAGRQHVGQSSGFLRSEQPPFPIHVFLYGQELTTYPAGTASSTKFQPLFTLANHFFALFSQSCVPPVRFLVWFDCAVFQFDLSSVIFVFLPAKTLDIEAEGEQVGEAPWGKHNRAGHEPIEPTSHEYFVQSYHTPRRGHQH